MLFKGKSVEDVVKGRNACQNGHICAPWAPHLARLLALGVVSEVGKVCTLMGPIIIPSHFEPPDSPEEVPIFKRLNAKIKGGQVSLPGEEHQEKEATSVV